MTRLGRGSSQTAGIKCSPAVQVLAYVNRVKDVTSDVNHATFTQADVESNDVRCPDSEAAKRMYEGQQQLPSKF